MTTYVRINTIERGINTRGLPILAYECQVVQTGRFIQGTELGQSRTFERDRDAAIAWARSWVQRDIRIELDGLPLPEVLRRERVQASNQELEQSARPTPAIDQGAYDEMLAALKALMPLVKGSESFAAEVEAAVNAIARAEGRS